MKSPRTTVDICAVQIDRLNMIAMDVGALSRSGPTHGKPSWRVLIKQIADGTLRVYAPGAKREQAPRQNNEWKKRGGKSAIPGAPAWWRPVYGNAMGYQYAIKKGATDAEIAALGLRRDINTRLPHPDIIIGKPEWAPEFVADPRHRAWWWIPGMDIGAAVVVSGYTREQLERGGLLVADGTRYAPPAEWPGWCHGELDCECEILEMEMREAALEKPCPEPRGNPNATAGSEEFQEWMADALVKMQSGP